MAFSSFYQKLRNRGKTLTVVKRFQILLFDLSTVVQLAVSRIQCERIGWRISGMGHESGLDNDFEFLERDFFI